MTWSSSRFDLHRALWNSSKGPQCLHIGSLRTIHELTLSISYHMHSLQNKVRRLYFYLYMFYAVVRVVTEEPFITYELQNHNID
jgi:hypothetical protein